MRLELTRKGDYAVRAMIALARADPGETRSTRRIAEEMNIPPRFLPQAMADLGRAGLVEARPGRSGGYRLARPAATIDLLEVIEAIEGDSRRGTCVLKGAPCGQSGYCDVHDTFFAAQTALLARLRAADLATLAGELTAGAAPNGPRGPDHPDRSQFGPNGPGGRNHARKYY